MNFSDETFRVLSGLYKANAVLLAFLTAVIYKICPLSAVKRRSSKGDRDATHKRLTSVKCRIGENKVGFLKS